MLVYFIITFVCSSVRHSDRLFFHLSVRPSVCLSVSPYIGLFDHSSVLLSVSLSFIPIPLGLLILLVLLINNVYLYRLSVRTLPDEEYLATLDDDVTSYISCLSCTDIKTDGVVYQRLCTGGNELKIWDQMSKNKVRKRTR